MENTTNPDLDFTRFDKEKAGYFIMKYKEAVRLRGNQTLLYKHKKSFFCFGKTYLIEYAKYVVDYLNQKYNFN